MRILCTNQALDGRGGSETYLETIAPELRALGHDVELFTNYAGTVAQRLRSEGFVVHTSYAELGSRYDVVHAQHASTALTVRSRLPKTPIVFASHSWLLDIEDPPPAATPDALVAFNDPVASRLRASGLGTSVTVHRLTQPVAISAFEKERVPIGATARRAVAVSRRLVMRLPALRAACEALGIELETIGRGRAEVADPTIPMMSADIVFASGRSVVEALALARAAFVYDETGAAGFVTAESYPRLESCGFTPEAGTPVDDLAKAIDTYDADLGAIGRELAVRHHSARRHAAELVEIYRSVTPRRSGRTAGAPEVLRALAVASQRLFECEDRARNAQWRAAESERTITALEDRIALLEAEHRGSTETP